ncbi:phosphoribosyltransferase domain-containing protein [Deinococcus arenicola]|uniref:Phosphoribosyltransferase domain-containing protein n=1 Tax=Deinococcus arenicola TaxID=2994950 RepID=A0ABU4DUQ3_9DEIO|nr:phosphoribosyltransferase domain-containing protein [Deinococcus sp. ZS9-10]MDV6375620.1 phosphoribosyltransferase domain-containing protein [Deinococcus sp. ZS9-10]
MTLAPTAQTVHLPSGTLELWLEAPHPPLKTLLDYAVRQNPRRGFLFVSRVLGKHIPVAPAVAARTYTELAAALPPLTAPHFIGLAETATALGEGVYHAWRGRHPEQTATFQHTTRYQTQHPLLLRFDEPHSHAPAHLLYDPGPAARAATELVLVDDELSTGTTLENLAREWRALHPHLARVVMVSLTDWCSRRAEIEARLGLPVTFVSLTRGGYEFTPAADWQPPALPAVTGNGADKSALLPAASPRYGQDVGLAWPELNLLPTDRVLVLGTGEYQYPAFALARRIEPGVASCVFSATTRSPVLEGLAMARKFSFGDNVGDGIPNYLYNVDPDCHTRILVTYEGGCLPDPALMTLLGENAEAVCLSPVEPR